jgi:hypothetical protein
MIEFVLADGFELGDLIYLAFLGLAALGGLIGQIKKKQSEQAKSRPDAGRKPTPRMQAPDARAPRAPQPPRPSPTPPSPPSRARPVARRLPQVDDEPIEAELLRPTRPRPTGRPPVVTRRPAPTRAQPARPAAPPIVEGETPAEAQPQERAAKQAVIRPRREGVELRRLQRLLRSQPGLRAGIVLSEILAPPVALRENHPF